MKIDFLKDHLFYFLFLLLLKSSDGWAQSGVLDNTFGNNGIVLSEFGFSNEIARAIAVQNDGKIILAGSPIANGEYGCMLIRYLETGSLDSSFGDNGFTTQNMDPLSTSQQVEACAIQPDGKILVAGSTRQWNNFDYYYDVDVLRFNTDGSLDSSFASNGKFTTDVGDNLAQYATTMVLQPDGKILIGGQASLYNNGGDVLVMRLNEDGSYDNSFGVGGTVITMLDSFLREDVAQIALQADNKILVTGNNVSLFTIRYLNDGTIDSSFGLNGISKTDLNPDMLYHEFSRAISLQSDNKIVVGADYYSNIDTEIAAIVRYNQDGSPDSTFGNDGTVIFSSPYSNILCSSIIAQSDNKIIMTGTINFGPYTGKILLARFNETGLLDSSFGINGITITEIGYSAICTAGILGMDGKIIIGGGVRLSVDSNYLFAIARYLNDINSGTTNEISFSNMVLEQNYPNPLRDQTTICYHLSTTSHVSLKVFNLLGREVAELIDAIEFPGNKEVQFDASGVERGIYFYRLQTEEQIKCKRMIVVR